MNIEEEFRKWQRECIGGEYGDIEVMGEVVTVRGVSDEVRQYTSHCGRFAEFELSFQKGYEKFDRPNVYIIWNGATNEAELKIELCSGGGEGSYIVGAELTMKDLSKVMAMINKVNGAMKE